MPEPIALHSWNSPNGRKISIALEEMGLDYDFQPVNTGTRENYGAAFAAINPNNKIPAITDPEGPDGKPVTIFESGAILLYLARKAGAFMGQGQRDRIEIEKWLMWQMGNLGPMAGQAEHFFDVAPRRQPPETITYGRDRYVTEARRLYAVLDGQLGQRPFVAGDFYSIADIAIFPWITGWRVQGQDITRHPHLHAWLDRLRARPAVQRGVMVGAGLRNDIRKGGSAGLILFGEV